MGTKKEGESGQAKQSIVMAKQSLFKFAQYCPSTGKIELSYEEVVARVKQVTKNNSSSSIVFATAVGQPKSGKTAALNRLVKFWDSVLLSKPELKFADPPGDFQGIQLLLSDVPRVFGSSIAYLACLDVVCDPTSPGYKRLMEVCCRMSNLIIFTFSKDSKSHLLKMEYRCKKEEFKAAASFNGYSDWNQMELSYFDGLEAIMPFLNEKSEEDDAAGVKKAILELSKMVKKFPVQVERAFKLYSGGIPDSNERNGSNEGRQEDIYSKLVDSLCDGQFKKTLCTSSNLLNDFLMLATVVKGEQASAEEERNGPSDQVPDSDFDVVVHASPPVVRKPFRKGKTSNPDQGETEDNAGNVDQQTSIKPVSHENGKCAKPGPKCSKERRSRTGLSTASNIADKAGLLQSFEPETTGKDSNGHDNNSDSGSDSSIAAARTAASKSRTGPHRSLDSKYLEKVVKANLLEVSEHVKEPSDNNSAIDCGTYTSPGEAPKLTGSDSRPEPGHSAYFPTNASKARNVTESSHAVTEQPAAQNEKTLTKSSPLADVDSGEMDTSAMQNFFEDSQEPDVQNSPLANKSNHNGNMSVSSPSTHQDQKPLHADAYTSAETSRPSLQPSKSRPKTTTVPPAFFDPTLDEQTVCLKVKTKFRKLSLLLIASVGNLRSSEESDTGFDIIQKWGDYINTVDRKSSTLNDLVSQLHDALDGLYSFTTSYQDIIDRNLKSCSYTEPGQMQNLRKYLKTNLDHQLVKVKNEKDYCLKIGETILNIIFSTVSAKNEANKAAEELLAENICRTAYDSYANQIDQLLQKRIFNDKAIKKLHKSVVTAVISSFSTEQTQDSVVWKQRIKNLGKRMTENSQDVLNRNARNLAQFRKTSLNSYKAFQREFDRLFSQHSSFACLNDLKIHRDAALAKALEQAKSIQQLPAAAREAEEKLTIYAFVKAMKYASSCPHAAKFLARTCHVTIMYPEGQLEPLKILVEDKDAVMLDPRLFVSDGNLVIVDSRIPGIFNGKDNGFPWLSISDMAFEDCFYKENQCYHEVSLKLASIETCKHPEQVIAAYFKEMKKHLLDAYKLLPVQLTIHVPDQASFEGRHRINSAIRLAGLPLPTFISKSERIPYEVNYSTSDKYYQTLVSPGSQLVKDATNRQTFHPSSGWKLRDLGFRSAGTFVQFKFTLPEQKKVICDVRLRKDGILCEPDIYEEDSKEKLQWEMTTGPLIPLMPWNHLSFDHCETLQGLLQELDIIKNLPLQQQRNSIVNNFTIKQETPATPRSTAHINGHSSHFENGSHGHGDFSSPSSRRSDLTVVATKEELAKFMDLLEKALSAATVKTAVSKQAATKLIEARSLLETEDIKPAKIAMMIKKLKINIETVTGSAVD